MDENILKRLQKASGLSISHIQTYLFENHDKPSFQNDLVDLFGFENLDEIAVIVQYYRNLSKKLPTPFSNKLDGIKQAVECKSKLNRLKSLNKTQLDEFFKDTQNSSICYKNKNDLDCGNDNLTQTKCPGYGQNIDESSRVFDLKSKYVRCTSSDESKSSHISNLDSKYLSLVGLSLDTNTKDLSIDNQPSIKTYTTGILSDVLDILFLEEDFNKNIKFLKNLPSTIKKYVIAQEYSYKMRKENNSYIFGRQDSFLPKIKTNDSSETSNIHIEAPSNLPHHPLIKTAITGCDLFPYDNFNTIQSICLSTAYFSNKNMLLSAPTGCGKTEIAFMAVCRALKNNGRIVYLVPLKALATEVTEKLKSRFKNKKILEFTGDTNPNKSEIHHADIFVATAEKFDVCTRRFNAINNISLVIIDEIHILNEHRGAVIEALVCRILRMIEIQQFNTRIIGLSATIPNYADIGAFILAQRIFHFGKEYRPVPLSIEIVGIKNDDQEKLDMDRICEDYGRFKGKGVFKLQDILKIPLEKEFKPENELKTIPRASDKRVSIIKESISSNQNNSKQSLAENLGNHGLNQLHDQTGAPLDKIFQNEFNLQLNESKTRQNTKASLESPDFFSISSHRPHSPQKNSSSLRPFEIGLENKSIINTQTDSERTQKQTNSRSKSCKKFREENELSVETNSSNNDYIRIPNSFGRTEKGKKASFRTENTYIPPHIAFSDKAYSFITKKLHDLFLKSHQCLIFCTSRKETEKIAKKLSKTFPAYKFDFHHAGLPKEKRISAENNFRKNKVNCLVTTSTLAWGVNLPARCVIIKDTKFYDKNIARYSKIGILDILQIFGRAGRPQFDKKGEAIIIVENKESGEYYNMLIAQKRIESTLLKSVVDFINAEIYLGNVKSLDDAYHWIQSSFLYVRMRKNPRYYGLSNEEIESNNLKGVICEYIVLAVKRLTEVGMICVDKGLSHKTIEIQNNTGLNGKSFHMQFSKETSCNKLSDDEKHLFFLNHNAQHSENQQTADFCSLKNAQNVGKYQESFSKITLKKNINHLGAHDKKIAFPQSIDIHNKTSRLSFLKKHKELVQERKQYNQNLDFDSENLISEKWVDKPAFVNSNIIEYIPISSTDCGMAYINWLSPHKLYFKSTPLGRIASHTYLRNETLELFMRNIDFVYDEYSITTLILQSIELSDIVARDDEADCLNLLASDINLVYEKTAMDKMTILLLCYKKGVRIDNFTLHCDQIFVLENYERVLGAFIELCIYLEKYSLLEYTRNLEKWFTERIIHNPDIKYVGLGGFIYVESKNKGGIVIQKDTVVGIQKTKFDFLKIDPAYSFKSLGRLEKIDLTFFEKLYKFGIHDCKNTSWGFFHTNGSCEHFKRLSRDQITRILDKITSSPSLVKNRNHHFVPSTTFNKLEKRSNSTKNDTLRKSEIIRELGKLDIAGRDSLNKRTEIDYSTPKNIKSTLQTEDSEKASIESLKCQTVYTDFELEEKYNFPIFTTDLELLKHNKYFTNSFKSFEINAFYVQNHLKVFLYEVDNVSTDEKLKLITKKILEIPFKKKMIISHSNADMHQTHNDLTTLFLLKESDSGIDRVKSGKWQDFDCEFVTTFEQARKNISLIPMDCAIVFKGLHGRYFSHFVDILNIIGQRYTYFFDIKSTLEYYKFVFGGENVY